MKSTQTRPPTETDRRRARRVILKSLQAIPEYKLLRFPTSVRFARSPKQAYQMVLSYMEKGQIVATNFETARNYPTGIPFGGWPFQLNKDGHISWDHENQRTITPLIKTDRVDWRIWGEARSVSFQDTYHKLWAEYEKAKPWDRVIDSMRKSGSYGSQYSKDYWESTRKRLRTADMKRLHRRMSRLAPQVTRAFAASPDPDIWEGILSTVDGRLIIVWEKPLVLKGTPEVNRNGWRPQTVRLHSLDGPAVEYRDGFTVWAVEGVVSRELSVDVKDITPQLVMRQTNQEIRRTLMERMGGGTVFLKKAGARLLDESKDSLGLPRKLWTIHRNRVRRWGDESEWSFLELTNSTPEPDGHHKIYVLRVPPTTQTAEDGQAWLAGMNANQYRPLRET